LEDGEYKGATSQSIRELLARALEGEKMKGFVSQDETLKDDSFYLDEALTRRLRDW
jgi:hypothetical protein